MLMWWFEDFNVSFILFNQSNKRSAHLPFSMRLHETIEQSREVGRGHVAVMQCVLVCDVLLGQAGCKVDDNRNGCDTQAAVARENDLGDGGHANNIGS
jgi:hypothetical protein